jgi:hypothetical protein
MRTSSILAVLLLLVAGVNTAWAQPPLTGYCRIYRCMTIGSSACYYCLPCNSCTGPVGYLGGWTESTGPCVACGTTGAEHCQFGAGAPGGPAPAAPSADPAPAPPGQENRDQPLRVPEVAPAFTTVAALTEEPEVLYNPEFTDDVDKWDLTIDIPGEGSVKALLVTAKIKPKKKGGEHHETAHLGFAVRCSGDLSAYPAVTAVGVKEHGTGYKFKFKEMDGTTHNKKCTIGSLSLLP